MGTIVPTVFAIETEGLRHHDKDRLAGNYANLSPLMDLLLGTYRCPDHEPEAFEISEPISKNYLGQMLHPFLPKAKRGGGD